VTSKRIAVVTGGTTGIGLAAARGLLSAGYRVAVFSQNEVNVLAAKDALGKEFGAEFVFATTADITNPMEINAFFAKVNAAWGSPAILVCNAGISPKSPGGALPFADIPLAEWNEVIAVNLTGAMLSCQAALPAMCAGGFGRIVIIGSVAARGRPKIAGASYVASKAALSGLARSLVETYSMHGITVNIIAPGRILTDMSGTAGSPSNLAALERIPARRFGKPEEIAALIVFLASDMSGFINGAIIDVNGGEFIAP
jgi:3-oxoacyl-[acyl-carrier protein] reductase